jgi:hypothetical protein
MDWSTNPAAVCASVALAWLELATTSSVLALNDFIITVTPLLLCLIRTWLNPEVSTEGRHIASFDSPISSIIYFTA